MTSHGAATSAEVRFRARFCTAFNLNCTLGVSSECCAKLRRFGEGALLADGAQARLQGGVSGVVHVNPVFFFAPLPLKTWVPGFPCMLSPSMLRLKLVIWCLDRHVVYCLPPV